MTKYDELMVVAQECEKYPIHDLVIFRKAFDVLHGPKPERMLGGSEEMTIWLNKFNPLYKLCDAGGFLDAAMMFGKGIPWLSPIINYPDGTVILVNGLGLPVGGNNYKSKAETIPLALLASWLKAQAQQSLQLPKENGFSSKYAGTFSEQIFDDILREHEAMEQLVERKLP